MPTLQSELTSGSKLTYSRCGIFQRPPEFEPLGGAEHGIHLCSIQAGSGKPVGDLTTLLSVQLYLKLLHFQLGLHPSFFLLVFIVVLFFF